jgi:hypothetical protein
VALRQRIETHALKKRHSRRRGKKARRVREGVGKRQQKAWSYAASIRQHMSADVSICQHTSAYVSIRQHTSAYVSIRQKAWSYAAIAAV